MIEKVKDKHAEPASRESKTDLEEAALEETFPASDPPASNMRSGEDETDRDADRRKKRPAAAFRAGLV